MDTKTKILESVIKESQKFAISKISTVKVANGANTSEANVFKIFKTKENLLSCTFLYIDEKLGSFIKEKIQEKPLDSLENVISFSKEAWLCYLDFFVKNDSYAMYYSSFRLSGLYDDNIVEAQADHFDNLSGMFASIENGYNIYSHVSFNLFWSFILDSTLLIAKRMATGEIEYKEENIEVSYHLIFDGLLNAVKNVNGK